MSSSTPVRPSTQDAVRLLQIITVALIAGVLTFGTVVVVLLGALNNAPQGELLSLIGAGFAVTAFVMHLVVPELIVRQTVPNLKDDPGGLTRLFVTKTIVASALLEGAAMFNLVALMQEHNWWSLLIVGGLVLWMASQIPTITRVHHWLETKDMEMRG